MTHTRSLTSRLAEFFTANPNVWIDGRELAGIAGCYGWRTRCSDIRRPPFNMQIDNRLRVIEIHGEPVTISEYRFVVVQEVRTEEETADDAPTPSAVDAGTP